MTDQNQPQPVLSRREKLSSLFRVAKISYKSAPSVFYLRIVSSILDSILPLATTFFAAQTTTQLAFAYSGHPGAGQLALTYVLLTALLGVLTTVWSSFERYLGRAARYRLESVISDQLIHQFLSLDYWRYDDKDTADLLDKARKFSNFFTYVFDTLGTILTAFISLITSIIASAFVSWWLALLLVVAVVPGLIIQYRLSKARVRHWAKNLDGRRKASGIEWQLTELNSIAELRLYGLVRYLVGLRRHYRDKDEKDQIYIERRFIGQELMASIIEAVAEVVALIYVASRIIVHAQPIGQFLYVQQIISRGLGAMRQVVQSFINVDEDLANLLAYDEFMSLPTQKPGARKLAVDPTSLEVNHVTFQYPHNDHKVLDDITLKVTAGQHIAIVGENGAGKSTLIKLLLGFYLPVKGEVLIDSIPTRELDLESWHEKVGVLQQSSMMFTYAVAKDNVLYGDVARPTSESRYRQAIQNAEAKDFLDKLPKKDNTYITQWMEDEDGTPGVSLSGGQLQRLALARNFYRDSPVIILDEPTSAIDALAESRIFKRLFNEKNKIIITVSHRLSTIKRADRIYFLENGKIVEEGTHADLIKKKDAYYKLFESQL